MPDSIHIKTENPHFTAIWNGEKTFEVRLNDRNYHTGQLLHLDEYNRETQKFSGRSILIHIKYVLLGGSFGIDMNHCVFGFDVLRKTQGNSNCRVEVELSQDVHDFYMDRAHRVGRTMEENLADELGEYRYFLQYRERAERK